LGQGYRGGTGHSTPRRPPCIMCGQCWGKAVGTGGGGRRKLFLRGEIAHYAAGQFDAKLKDNLRAL